MRPFLLLLPLALAAAPATAQTVTPGAPDTMKRIAPALAGYTDQLLFEDIWKRPGLSPRDRSLVTLSVLIATGKTEQLSFHIPFALQNGVTPAEIGGLITHLAFYAGWPDAVSAIGAADTAFKARNIPDSALAPARAALLPRVSGKAAFDAANRQSMRASSSIAALTNDVLFDDLWRRQDLTPRDRSLVTIAAVTARGDAGEFDFHYRRGLANGLTRAQLGEAMTQIAFYAGFPRAIAGTQALGKVEDRTAAK